jgi:hypothetical protein
MSKEMPHVVQARNELANAEAYGQGDRATAARKVLAAAGVHRQAAASGDEGAARHTAPQGRTAPPRQTTAAEEPDGTTKQIREWAAKTGLTVSARGRIPDEVVAAYHRAHKEE